MFKDIQSILPKSIQRSGLGKKMDEVRVLEEFTILTDKLLPGDVRSGVRPMSLNARVLTVASLSSFATSLLKKNEAALIKELNQTMKAQLVRKIVYLTWIILWSVVN